MNGVNEKNHDTGLRLLELLKILLSDTLTRRGLIMKMKNTGKTDRFYTPEAMLKYFNTLAAAGFDIEKIKTKYKLKNGFYKLELTAKEKELLIELVKNYTKIHDRSVPGKLKHILSKIDKYLDFSLEEEFEKIKKLHEEDIKTDIKCGMITALENYMLDKRNASITCLKAGKEEIINCEIKEIFDDKDAVLCYIPELKKNKRLYFRNIIKIENCKKPKNQNSDDLQGIVFEVTGRLAALYKLKPSEEIIDMESDGISIVNKSEDKDELLLRLLKYGENCKILYPVEVKEEFLALTDKIIAGLENAQ